LRGGLKIPANMEFVRSADKGSKAGDHRAGFGSLSLASPLRLDQNVVLFGVG